MTKRSNAHENLLADLIHEDWADGSVAHYATVAAAYARRRRRTKRLLAFAGSVGSIALVLIFSGGRRSDSPTLIRATPAPPAAYEIISDQDLLSQLGDRPVLLVDLANGRRELVMLDH
jgi:hypothetical protein